MKTVWLLYILVYFNDDPKLELQEYNTKQECEQEKVRVIQEIKEVYNINAEVQCLYTIQDR
jgi:hypothetical protein